MGILGYDTRDCPCVTTMNVTDKIHASASPIFLL
jgi:hypothetical protein